MTANIPRHAAGIPSSRDTTYQLRVTLRDVTPQVWRRLLVSGSTTLSTFNHIIQVAMGWTNSHLHSLEARGTTYLMPDPESQFAATERNERGVRLDQVLTVVGDRCVYVYDFGDSWTHDVVVEGIYPRGRRFLMPICIGGARACPPEDCGGSGAYADLLDALADPDHEDYARLHEWIGFPLDPEGFDCNHVNRKLMRWRRPVKDRRHAVKLRAYGNGSSSAA